MESTATCIKPSFGRFRVKNLLLLYILDRRYLYRLHIVGSESRLILLLLLLLLLLPQVLVAVVLVVVQQQKEKNNSRPGSNLYLKTPFFASTFQPSLFSLPILCTILLYGKNGSFSIQEFSMRKVVLYFSCTEAYASIFLLFVYVYQADANCLKEDLQVPNVTHLSSCYQ